MTTLTEEEIINSQAFKVINFQIDEKVAEIKWLFSSLKDAIERAAQSKYTTIDTRVSYEDGGRRAGAVDIGFVPIELKSHSNTVVEILACNEAIRELNALKLRLLNDYDFTHGDPATQEAIFGKVEDVVDS